MHGWMDGWMDGWGDGRGHSLSFCYGTGTQLILLTRSSRFGERER